MRRRVDAELGANSPRKLFGAGGKPGIGAPREELIGLRLLKEAELSEPLVKASPRSEKPSKQVGGGQTGRGSEESVDHRLLSEAEEIGQR